MLKIVAYDKDERKIGSFYIPEDTSKEWIEKTIPPIIRVIQLLAGGIEETGY